MKDEDDDDDDEPTTLVDDADDDGVDVTDDTFDDIAVLLLLDDVVVLMDILGTAGVVAAAGADVACVDANMAADAAAAAANAIAIICSRSLSFLFLNIVKVFFFCSDGAGIGTVACGTVGGSNEPDDEPVTNGGTCTRVGDADGNDNDGRVGVDGIARDDAVVVLVIGVITTLVVPDAAANNEPLV